MRLTLLCSLLLSLCTGVLAQDDCPPDLNVVLTSQTDLIIYAATYPNCPTLTSLTIGDGSPNNIDDLTPLANTSLSRVTSGLTIQNTELETLTGLPERIESSVTITNNNDLLNLDGLNRFGSTTLGTITITDNDLLADCSVELICGSIFSSSTTVTISGNTGDCATEADVRNGCFATCSPDLPFLVDLYLSLDGENWDNNDGWRSPTSCQICTWPYITCDANGRVTEIRIEDDGLGGMLPETGWNDLTELTAFELESSTSIIRGPGGTVPAELFALQGLEEIIFRGPLFTALPANTGAATDLKVLRLSSMPQLSGNFPDVSTMLDLEELVIDFTVLSGPIPAELGNLTNLRFLDIGGRSGSRRFTGAIPDLSALTQLEEIHITWEQELDEWINMGGSLSNKPNLREIEINLSGLDIGTLPASLPGLPAITDFQIFCGIPGSVIVLPDSDILEFYDLRTSAGLTTPTELNVGPTTVIRRIDLANNGFSGPLFTIPARYAGLQSLRMQGNSFDGPLWPEPPVNNFSELNLAGSNLTGYLPAYLGEMNFRSTFQRLTLSDNNFVGCYPDTYTSLYRERFSSIEYYALFDGNVGLGDFEDFADDGTACRQGCPQDYEALVDLYVLSEGWNWTDNTGWLDFGGPTCDISTFLGVTVDGNDRVTDIALPNNNLTGEITSMLGNLDQLSNLNLSNNNLTGCYPEGLLPFCSITTDFSGNTDLPDGGSAAFFSNRFCPNGLDACGGDCPLGDVLLTTDAEIQNFQTFFPNCAVLEGDVTIEGTGITDLGDFSGLTEVQGELVLSELSVMTVSAFDNLIRVGGNLRLDDLPNAATVSFPALDSLGGDLDLADLPLLTDMSGFSNLATAEGSLILNVTGVTSLAGLGGIQGNIGGDLTLLNNTDLVDLGYLGGGGPGSNARGVAISQINSLRMIGNTSLTSLETLGDVEITRDILLLSNSSLSECAVPPVCEQLEGNQTATISTNAAGCNTRAEVEAACLALPVDWLSFEATAGEKSVKLNWSTALEVDNERYEVQRTAATEDRWVTLATLMPAAPGADGVFAYAFEDESPLPGEALYRIRQVDFSGTESFSPWRVVRFADLAARVYPNPAHGELTVVSSVAQRVSLLDITGREVAGFEHAGDGAQVLRLGVRPGVYLLRLVGEGRAERLLVR